MNLHTWPQAVRRIGLLTCLGLVALLACGGSPLLTEETRDQVSAVIAQGDRGLELKATWLLDKVNGGSFWPPGGIIPQEELREYFDTMLLDTLTGLSAQDLPLRDYPGQYWSFRLRYRRYLAEATIAQLVRYRLAPDSAELRDFYEQNPEAFSVEAQVDLYHILISPRPFLAGLDSAYFKSLDSAAFADTVRGYATSLHDSLLAGADFGLIAQRYSHDQMSRGSFGYVGWTPHNRYYAPFDSVAFSLEPWELAAPYQDVDGWHIIMIGDKVDSGVVPYDREGIADMVRDGYIQTKTSVETARLVDSLRRSARYEFNDELLDKDPFKVDDTLWAAVVNGTDTIITREVRSEEFSFRRRYGVDVTTPDIRRLMVVYIAKDHLLGQLAREKGFDTLPLVASEYSRLRHLAAKSTLEGLRFDPHWVPSDSAVRQYYDEHIEDFVTEKPVSFSQIVCNDSVLADYLTDLGQSGYEFERLVDEYVPPGEGFEARYEDVRRVGPGDLDKRLYAVVQSSQVGGVSRPVGTDEGYHIVKVHERVYNRDYSQARGLIMSELTQQYRAASIDLARDTLIQRFNVTFPNSLPRIRAKNINER